MQWRGKVWSGNVMLSKGIVTCCQVMCGKGIVRQGATQQRYSNATWRYAKAWLSTVWHSKGTVSQSDVWQWYSYVRSGYAKVRFCLVSQSKGIVQLSNVEWCEGRVRLSKV